MSNGKVSITEVRVPRYLARFACIGRACESTCCSGWRVDLDRDSFLRLQRAMSGTEEERAEFARSVTKNPNGSPKANNFALAVLRPDGDCSFLDDEGLCSLQRRYGEGILSITCATYPRRVDAIGHRMELTATPSCPEIARLLLLHDDANEPESVPVERVPRRAVQQMIAPNEADAYRASFEIVQDGMLQILLETRVGLAARLGAIGCVADETRAWFHAGIKGDPRGRVREAFDRYADVRALAMFERELPNVGERLDLGAGLVLRFLGEGVRDRKNAFGELLARIGLAYASRDDARTPEAVLASYRARRDRWTERFPERIDRYFTNWAIAYAARTWYVFERDLAEWVLRLFVRVATLRFLLFGHPLLDEAEREADVEARGRALDRAVVDVVQRYTRGIEHSSPLVAKLDAMVREAAPSVAHAMFLLNL